MTVDEFYAWIRETVNRGGTLDASLRGFIQSAVRDIESQYDFRGMHFWLTGEIEKDEIPIIQLPQRFKKLHFVRLDVSAPGNDPDWHTLVHLPQRKTTYRKGIPHSFWLSGLETMELDAVAVQTFPMEIHCSLFSEWPAEESDVQSHWLLEAAPIILWARTMLSLSDFIREDDPSIRASYRRQYQEGLQRLIQTDAGAVDAGMAPSMGFWPDHIPWSEAYE